MFLGAFGAAHHGQARCKGKRGESCAALVAQYGKQASKQASMQGAQVRCSEQGMTWQLLALVALCVRSVCWCGCKAAQPRAYLKACAVVTHCIFLRLTAAVYCLAVFLNRNCRTSRIRCSDGCSAASQYVLPKQPRCRACMCMGSTWMMQHTHGYMQAVIVWSCLQGMLCWNLTGCCWHQQLC
jgi:hypothetical protein